MLLALLRLSVASGAAVAVSALAFTIVGTPSRVRDRLGYRGLNRQRALSGAVFSAVEPLVRWLGARLSGLLPPGVDRWLDRQLVLSGDYLGLTPDEYIASTVLGFVFSLVGSFAYVKSGGAGAAALVLVVTGTVATYTQVSREAVRRSRDIARGLPYVIDLLALGMSAGLDFPAALRQVVSRSTDRKDALNEELDRILHELALGHTRLQALESFADRTTVVAARELVAAIVQAEQRGNPLAQTLAIQAQVSRQQRSLQAEMSAAKKATALYVPLALLMVSVLLLIGGPLVLQMRGFLER
jgi:tight adherence protein C